MYYKNSPVSLYELKENIEPKFKNMRKSNGSKYNSNLYTAAE